MYEDKDGERKAEIDALSGPNESNEFYNRLKQVREYHKRHPNEIYITPSLTSDSLSINSISNEGAGILNIGNSAMSNTSIVAKFSSSSADCN